MKEKGMSRRERVVNPKVPSQPTACKAGTLYFVTNFSSNTICVATITWEEKMRRSPTKMLVVSFLQSLL